MTGLEQITHEAESLPPPPSPDSPSVHLVKELVQLLTALLVAVYRGQPRPGGELGAHFVPGSELYSFHEILKGIHNQGGDGGRSRTLNGSIPLN